MIITCCLKKFSEKAIPLVSFKMGCIRRWIIRNCNTHSQRKVLVKCFIKLFPLKKSQSHGINKPFLWTDFDLIFIKKLINFFFLLKSKESKHSLAIGLLYD